MQSAGYSGTPLGKKLGYRQDMRVFIDGMPDPVRHDIERSIGQQPNWIRIPESGLEAAHIFVTRRADLDTKLAALRTLFEPDGFVWVSWPKNTAKVDSDISEDDIRSAILSTTDWVDVKVCAIDATWSGLKLVIRKEKR
ncbi:MAG: hypothetical protein ABI667_10085 [Sphingomicrobium sp.]